MDVIMLLVFFAAIIGIPLLIYHLKEKKEEREAEERRESEKKEEEEETIERIKRYKKLEIDLSNKFQDDLIELGKEKIMVIHSVFQIDMVREGKEHHLMPYVTFILTPGKIIITSFKNRFIFSMNEVKKVHLYFGGIIIEAAKESTEWKAECTAEFEESIRFYEYAESLGIPSQRHTAVTEGKELECERMPSI
jgi:hypothetical protein